MKICLIGVGHWGKNHARTLAQLRDENKIEELYIYDTNKNLAKSTANLFNTELVADETQLHKLDFDAVDIVVPANLHYQVAKPFVERGINTFIEKPFTDNLEEAQKLIDMVSKPSHQIMVGHIFRYHAGVTRTKQLISSNAIGKPLKLDIRRLAFGVPRPDNGVIFSLAIHDLDLFAYLLGKFPTSIQTISSKIYGPTEDHAVIKLNFEDNNDNVTCLAEESWMSFHPRKIRSLSVQGSNGEIFLDFLKPSEIIFNNKYLNEDRIVDNGIFTQTLPFEEPLYAELSHFIESTTNRTPYSSDEFVGINAVKLCLKAIESADSNQIIYF